MKLMAIDGNSIINRAFYGIRPLNAPDGTPTNAVYGFLLILQKLVADELPDALCVTFDLPVPTFRHERYKDYKAQRKPMPDDLRVQMPVLKEILGALNIQIEEQPGWEADDLLGSIAKKCEAQSCECIIVTGDRDSFQLITESTRVRLIKTRAGQTETINYTETVFTGEYGFEPDKLVDLKALMGDASDNIPGVAGIGEKTATDIIRRFGGIDAVFARLETLDVKDSVRKKLADGADMALLSYELAAIRRDAPMALTPNDCVVKPADGDRLHEIFLRLGFRSFLNNFDIYSRINKRPAQNRAFESREIASFEQCRAILKAAESDCVFAVSLTSDNAGFSAAAFSEKDGEAYVLNRVITKDFDRALESILSGSVKKAGHNVKDIYRVCLDTGLGTGGWIFDTALAAYLLSPTDPNYDIPRISKQYLGYAFSGSESAADTDGQMTMLGNESERAENPLAGTAAAIYSLRPVLNSLLLRQGLSELFLDVEMPLCEVLASMENTGFAVDSDALIRYGKMLGDRIAETEKQVHKLAGAAFNVNSPKQLGTVLFDKLLLPLPKKAKTKTGYSTNADVLQFLSGKHPIIDSVAEYRELSKLKSTYADGLLKVAGDDGRIHSHFQMTVTATGRLSSTEPNLQNIPVRKEMGEKLRAMFVADEGCLLSGADYSQIELRILAYIAQDPVMLETFKRGDDIHTATASQVFNTLPGDVTPTQRYRAKAVNFGIVYGISAFSLANDIGVTPAEAKAYMDSYFEKYAKVREYMNTVVEVANRRGYVETLFGRRRYLPELKSANHNTRAFGERVALNMPIQGTAADIIKIAMIKAARRLVAENLKSRLILQVHDELIVECPEEEAALTCKLLKEEMENIDRIDVPLVADARSGKTWHDIK